MKYHKKLNKIISILLIVMVAISLVGCNKEEKKKKLHITLILDTQGNDDKSFNYAISQTAIKWSEQNNATLNYFSPYDTIVDRKKAIDHAANIGSDVIILPSYAYASEMIYASDTYPDIKVIGLDIGKGEILSAALKDKYSGNVKDYNVKDYYNYKNTYTCTYKEEISGYLAGYAAVSLGNRHIGFVGGIEVPAVKRYGYGFLQGINDAAKKLGITKKIKVEYVYSGKFYSDAAITSYIRNWYYNKHIDVVFSCGGAIYSSVAKAADEFDGKMIGVDTDQKEIIETKYKNVKVITSAQKGLDVTITKLLDAISNNEWDKYAGKIENLGLISNNLKKNFVQIPYDTTRWENDFRQEEYSKLVSKIRKDKIKISSDVEGKPKLDIKVNYYPTIIDDNE